MLYNTDKEWEKYGASDPYFAVLTHQKYHKSNLSDDVLSDFFSSGEKHIEHILGTIRKHLDPNFVPRKALDFGCGVGRLLIPLAKVSEHVVGMDVSDSMLKEAKKNCDSHSIKNVSLIKSDDNLSLLSETYNFIHSFIVFQHIPVNRGEKILERMIEHLDEGGLGVLHFTYFKSNRFQNIRNWVKFVPFAYNVYNLVRRQSFFSPNMQINLYNINWIILILQHNGVSNFFVELTDHDGKLGVVLYFIKYASN